MPIVPQFPPPAAPVVVHSGPADVTILIVALTVIAAITLVLFPLVRAWARRLEGSVPRDDSDSQLGSRLEHVEQRLADAEERLDFAERMLARGPDPVALPRDKAD